MNAELLKKSHDAITRLYYNEPLPGNEKIAEAVLRETILACAEIAHGWYGCEDEAANIEREIRALLTAAEAAAPLPDAS